LDFHLNGEGQTVTVGTFPGDFNGLFGSGINGTLEVTGTTVPIDVTSNIEVNFESDGDVDVLFPWCVNARIRTEGMANGSTLTFEEAYFGGSTDILMSDDVTLEVVNGYLNRHASVKTPITRLRLRGNLTVFAESQFLVDDFDFVGNDALLHIVYRFGNLPNVVLNRISTHEKFSPTVTFAHEDSDPDEAEYIGLHGSEFYGLYLPIICGDNLGCEEWKGNFSSSASVLNGSTSVVDGICMSQSSTRQCYGINFPTPAPTATPLPSPTAAETPSPTTPPETPSPAAPTATTSLPTATEVRSPATAAETASETTPVESQSPTPTATRSPSHSPGLSTGAIIGITFGSVGFVAIVALVVIFLIVPKCRGYSRLKAVPLKSEIFLSDA
jgi:hypothetical protein